MTTNSDIIIKTNNKNKLSRLISKDVKEPQFVYVGGKGGVGKTSTSSAIAIKLADEGFRTLIVSTDPAHSLGDALDIDLSSAIEIDIEKSLDEFKSYATELDSDKLSNSLGIPKDLIDAIGINDLSTIFSNPPPDTEITGVYGLRFFGLLAHQFNKLLTKKLTIFSGKGGVGKTSTSASFAVSLSDVGFKTLLVSTDPAHSLGDILLEKLSSQPKLIDRSTEGGQLWAMEIDPIEGLKEFKSLLKESNDYVKDVNDDSLNIDEIKSDLIDIISGVNDPPPGTDEIVALTKIISYLQSGYKLPNDDIIKFDRIVLDTAPTGHTIRIQKNEVELIEIPYFDMEARNIYGLKAFGSILFPN
eukprot:gene18324-24014_t